MSKIIGFRNPEQEKLNTLLEESEHQVDEMMELNNSLMARYEAGEEISEDDIAALLGSLAGNMRLDKEIGMQKEKMGKEDEGISNWQESLDEHKREIRKASGFKVVK